VTSSSDPPSRPDWPAWDAVDRMTVSAAFHATQACVAALATARPILDRLSRDLAAGEPDHVRARDARQAVDVGLQGGMLGSPTNVAEALGRLLGRG
jgi:hypothetical protein